MLSNFRYITLLNLVVFSIVDTFSSSTPQSNQVNVASIYGDSTKVYRLLLEKGKTLFVFLFLAVYARTSFLT